MTSEEVRALLGDDESWFRDKLASLRVECEVGAGTWFDADDAMRAMEFCERVVDALREARKDVERERETSRSLRLVMESAEETVEEFTAEHCLDTVCHACLRMVGKSFRASIAAIDAAREGEE